MNYYLFLLFLSAPSSASSYDDDHDGDDDDGVDDDGDDDDGDEYDVGDEYDEYDVGDDHCDNDDTSTMANKKYQN